MRCPKERETTSVWRIDPGSPSGTAEIDGRPVDVVSEGAFLPKGTNVRVVTVEGARVVVRKA